MKISNEYLLGLAEGAHCGQVTLDRDVPRMAEELLALRAFVDRIRAAYEDDETLWGDIGEVAADALEDLAARLGGIDPS